jgi:hypothetical protein
MRTLFYISFVSAPSNTLIEVWGDMTAILQIAAMCRTLKWRISERKVLRNMKVEGPLQTGGVLQVASCRL